MYVYIYIYTYIYVCFIDFEIKKYSQLINCWFYLTINGTYTGFYLIINIENRISGK